MRCAGPQASLTATISSNTAAYLPERKAPRSITMSISSAPAATASPVSRDLDVEAGPPGRERGGDTRDLDPAAGRARSWRPGPGRGRRRSPRRSGQLGSAGSGRRALAHRARDLAGCVLALERREVDHRDGQVEGVLLRGRLDRPGGEGRGPGLGAHLVDAGEARHEQVQARVGGTDRGDPRGRQAGRGRHRASVGRTPRAARDRVGRSDRAESRPTTSGGRE